MPESDVRVLTRDGTTTLAFGSFTISRDTIDRATGSRSIHGTLADLTWQRPVGRDALANGLYLLELGNGLAFGARLVPAPGAEEPVRNAAFQSVGPIEVMAEFIEDENADRPSDWKPRGSQATSAPP